MCHKRRDGTQGLIGIGARRRQSDVSPPAYKGQTCTVKAGSPHTRRRQPGGLMMELIIETKYSGKRPAIFND